MKYCPNCGKPIKQGWNTCPYCGEDLSRYKKDKPPPISFGKDNVVVKPSFGDIKQTIMEIEKINIEGTTKCPSCGNPINANNSLKKCRACGRYYCSKCEIDGIACPHCGTPYQPLAKMRCENCGGIFAITERDRRIIEKMNKEVIAQKCRCPICKEVFYYSGDIGFHYLGEYPPEEILKQKNTNFCYVPLINFRENI